MPTVKETHHPKNVIIYKEDDLLPELDTFTDVLFLISDVYSTTPPPFEEIRDYAVKMTRSHFGVSIEEALENFEIIIIPVVSFYEDSGRIFARKIR